MCIRNSRSIYSTMNLEFFFIIIRYSLLQNVSNCQDNLPQRYEKKSVCMKKFQQTDLSFQQKTDSGLRT